MDIRSDFEVAKMIVRQSFQTLEAMNAKQIAILSSLTGQYLNLTRLELITCGCQKGGRGPRPKIGKHETRYF